MKRQISIDIIVNDGSPIGVSEASIYGNDGSFGVGGAELMLLTLCRAWTEYGYNVRLYNSPRKRNASIFQQFDVNSFVPEDDRDFLIIFRSPNNRAKNAKGRKIWWSTDQYTVGDFREFAKSVDKIVTISNFHADHFRQNYGINDSIVIDIPVREWDYKDVSVDRNMKQVLFSSVPDRGLFQMADVWRMIVEEVPDAKLVITSDWRLWNPEIPASILSQFRLKFAEFSSVEYKAVVPRQELVKIQLESYLHVYPCIYDELFCISVAESQYAGCYPITTTCGALQTTNMGFKSKNGAMSHVGQIELAQQAINMLNYPNEYKASTIINHKRAENRFSIRKAISKWNQSVFC